MRRLAATAAMILAVPAFAASAKPLTVINETDAAIEYVYAAACGTAGWGKDLLGAKEIIDPGARRQLTIFSRSVACCYDLRAKLHTGASRQKLSVDLCREPEWVIH